MHALQNVLERNTLVATGLLCLCLTHCGGKAFQGLDEPSEASSGNGGVDAAAGTTSGGSHAGSGGSNSAGSGGSSDVAGAGGSAGSLIGSCDCPAGSYCRDASRDCFACSDLSRVKFTSPERLTTLSDNGQGSRFPRSGSTATDLLYRFDGVGLRYTTDASTSPGGYLSATDPTDSAPLLLDAAVSGLTTEFKVFNFVFDRAEGDAPRSIYFAQWNDGLQKLERASAPFNTDAGDYSMAVARHPEGGVPRAFWMSRRDATAESPLPMLLTALLALDAASDAVSLSIGRAKPICDPKDSTSDDIDPDLTPWVTPDAKLLLLSTTGQDDSCQLSGQKKDLYSVLLQPELGQPAPDSPARLLIDVNGPDDDTDPSLSADMCELYFASNRDGKYAVYRAHRR
jgi:hypothetical protein